MKSKTKAESGRLPGDFQKLNNILPLRPIDTALALKDATALADRLAVLNRRTPDQDAYLETLSLLIEKYEDTQHSIDTTDLDPVDTLRFLLDEDDMNASDLGRLLGQRQLGAKILRGERELSKHHIQLLCARFNVAPGLFLKPLAR